MSRQTSNWVDRGDPVEAPLSRILGAALGVAADDARLAEHTAVILGQVEAQATEGDVATYVGSVFPSFNRPLPEVDAHRLLGTALWHIAKLALVRDRKK